MRKRALVVGAGPNGLAAAIVLAQAGLAVEVHEANHEPGGAALSNAATLTGFVHDFGSAVHPLGLGSPFFRTLPLGRFGLEWLQPDAPLAHPLDGGRAVVLEKDLSSAVAAFGHDGAVWRKLLEPFVLDWDGLIGDALAPSILPQHPLLMARFGANAFLSAERLADRFQSSDVRALWGGIAAHSVLPLHQVMSSAGGLILAVAAHTVGWPIPKGGASAITKALIGYLEELGGRVIVDSPVKHSSQFDGYDAVLCDVSPRQLCQIASSILPPRFQLRLQRFRYGPGAFKMDWALNRPIPWAANDCRRSATVHVGGSYEEIAASENAVAKGQIPERPFVLLAQPTLFDPSRAPAGCHTAWAYCHVPNGSIEEMTSRTESQIERFAPGFGETILARKISSPADLERADANLVGGDVNCGLLDLPQFLIRPTWRRYATPVKHLYLCSAATAPGGGVHGMCGFHAAQLALRRL